MPLHLQLGKQMNEDLYDLSWIEYFFGIAKEVSSKSKDPSTKVGAIAVDPKTKRILATGYNGFPTGVKETEERWSRPTKYDFVVHAEANIVVSAARFGISLTGCDLYVLMHPCVDCAKLIAAAGIKRIFYLDKELKQEASREWVNHLENAKAIFNESGIDLYACKEVKEVQEKKHIIEHPECRKTWKGCVDKLEDLSAKHSVLHLGDLIFVKQNNTLYEWNGIGWVSNDEYTHIV